MGTEAWGPMRGRPRPPLPTLGPAPAAGGDFTGSAMYSLQSARCALSCLHSSECCFQLMPPTAVPSSARARNVTSGHHPAILMLSHPGFPRGAKHASATQTNAIPPLTPGWGLGSRAVVSCRPHPPKRFSSEGPEPASLWNVSEMQALRPHQSCCNRGPGRGPGGSRALQGVLTRLTSGSHWLRPSLTPRAAPAHQALAGVAPGTRLWLTWQENQPSGVQSRRPAFAPLSK